MFFSVVRRSIANIFQVKSNNSYVGAKPGEVLGPDPLLVHYREENERLQNANEELAEKVRTLEESLAERDCCDDPCEKVRYMRTKIAMLRDRFAAERKQYTMLIDYSRWSVIRFDKPRFDLSSNNGIYMLEKNCAVMKFAD